MIAHRARVTALVLVALFLLDAVLMRLGWLRAIDHGLLGWDRIVGADRHFSGSPALLAGLIAITDLGAAPARITVALASVATLLALGRRRAAVALAVAVATNIAALPLLKLTFGRARPDPIWWLVAERHTSFPSGHAMGSMVLYPLVGALLGRARTWMVAGIALALAIGATRVLLGVHWPSDVAAGWLVGGAWAALAIGYVSPFRVSAPPAT